MIPLCVLVLVVVNVVTLGKLNDQHVQLNSQREAITKTRTQLKATSESLKRVEGEKTTIDESYKQEREKAQNLEQENQSLKVNLQAKKEREAEAAKQQAVAASVQEAPKLTQAAPAQVQATGSCADWLAQAGVTDVANAQELIRRESGCNPHAVNPSSGACGVAQELPCGKSGCSLGDGACQIAWMQRYVNGRYGGWAGAIAFHNAMGWY